MLLLLWTRSTSAIWIIKKKFISQVSVNSCNSYPLMLFSFPCQSSLERWPELILRPPHHHHPAPPTPPMAISTKWKDLPAPLLSPGLPPDSTDGLARCKNHPSASRILCKSPNPHGVFKISHIIDCSAVSLQHVLNMYGGMICNTILFLKWCTHPKDAFIN